MYLSWSKHFEPSRRRFYVYCLSCCLFIICTQAHQMIFWAKKGYMQNWLHFFVCTGYHWSIQSTQAEFRSWNGNRCWKDYHWTYIRVYRRQIWYKTIIFYLFKNCILTYLSKSNGQGGIYIYIDRDNVILH